MKKKFVAIMMVAAMAASMAACGSDGGSSDTQKSSCIRVSIQALYSVIYLTLQEYQQVQEWLSHYLHVSCFVHSSQVLQDFLQRSLRCIRLFQPWPTCLLSSVS